MRASKSVPDSGPAQGRHQKKASIFWTLSKSGLDPPPLLFGHCEVTFVSAYLG